MELRHLPYLWSAGIVVLTFILMSAGSQTSAVTVEPLVLRPERLPFTPEEFYIADIVDERKDRKAVAYLFPASPVLQVGATVQPVNLQGGELPALKEFVKQSLPRNPKLRPVVIRLQECMVRETTGEKGSINGRVVVRLAFDLQRESGNVRLVEYTGGAKYVRSASQRGMVEPTLRQSLAGGLQYLNTWMNNEAGRHEKLAKGIKINFIEQGNKRVDDTVHYHPSRPLTWNDFTGQPKKTSHYGASVFPGFSYHGDSEVKNGIIHLHVTLNVFMVQSSSWVKPVARDNYALNHEQRHFDIAKLVAEKFKKRIDPDNLTIEDYNSQIQYQYLEAYREMNRMQELYDSETRHSLDSVAQERWNKKIDADLQALGVKK
ncbi:hypothetical protein FVR03_08640 [Pontibacter qinzhouensis]|uniref:DUF922 domain-containing protein n=1 Tax=Pontibacter qinzhouensis TaxID=2603253 RepID=A0A5C8K6Z1_9BACT|nr:hypothetical protein FVR03_08640 [Pontibacter qinzhouensis]